MNKLTIRWRIVLSFTVILLLMTVMSALDYSRLLRIEAETSGVEHSALTGLLDAVALRDAWSEHLAAASGVALAQADPEAAGDRLQSARDTLSTVLRQVEGGAVAPDMARSLDAFKSAQTSYAQSLREILKLAADPARRGQAAALYADRLLPEYERGRTALDTLVHSAEMSATTSMVRLDTDVTNVVVSAKRSVAIDLLAALILSGLCGAGLMVSVTRPLATLKQVVDVMRAGDFTRRVSLGRRDEFGALAGGVNGMADDLTLLVGQVQESGLKVSSSVVEIAATTREQQATANEVAATTAEIGATSREISATSKELVRTMNDVAAAAEQSAAIAGSGQAGLTRMEQSMRNVIDAAGSVNAKLGALNEKAGDISQVVVTITKVADQTNLLSLNAAIEAEKAGEYGRGFAVVATEIRRLADQTAIATHDIDRMVKAMQSAVSGGVMSMDKFSEEVRRGMQVIQEVGGQLTEVIQHTQALAPRFDAVTEGMQAQATGAEQITESLSQLSEAARQTVESLRQSNAAMDDLNQVVLALRTGVSKFTLQAA